MNNEDKKRSDPLRAKSIFEEILTSKKVDIIGDFEIESSSVDLEVSPIIDSNRPLVVTIHGIRTKGEWQDLYSIIARTSGIDCEPGEYGYFTIGQTLSRKNRDFLIKDVNKKLFDVRQKYPGREISVVAHSMGSFAICKALEDNPNLVLDRLIICGTFLPRDFNWNILFERKQISGLLHQIGKADKPVRLAPWFIGDAGMSIKGFTKCGPHHSKEQKLNSHYHSDFFTVENMKDNWNNFFLKKDDLVKEIDAPRSGSVNWRFYITLTLVLVPLSILLIWKVFF